MNSSPIPAPASSAPESQTTPNQAAVPAGQSAPTPASMSESLSYRRALLHLPDAILCIDDQWRITFANDQAMRLSHLRPEDLGRDHWELYPQTIGTEIERTYRRAMTNRAEEHFEFFYPPFQVWYDLTIVPSEDGGLLFYYRDVTAAKTLAAERDRSLRQVEQVLAASPDAVIILEPGWTLAYTNPQAVALLGIGGPLGESVWARLPGSSTDAFASKYRRTMEERVNTEFEIFTEDPHNRWFCVHARPFGPTGAIIFFTDITSHKEAELTLRESEERYRVLADLNPQSIWMAAVDGTITYVNQTLLDLLGSDRNPVSNPWILNIAEPDRERTAAAWNHSIATGDPYDIQLRLLRAADGEPRWAHLRAQPVRSSSGDILRWIGVAIDIHEQHTAAESLQHRQHETERERAELETLYQTAPIGLALFDPVEFRYLRLNERQAAFFGLPPQQIVGKLLTEMAPIPGLRELFEQVAAGTPVINFPLEGELATQPGEHRFWTVNYFPVHGSNGSVEAISAASLEITQQKKAEAALMQSEKLAAVGRLASSISHEINNPLEAITNLLFLAGLDPRTPDDVCNYITLAQAELSRVSQIATQTLRFHRQAARPTRVSAAQLVDAVLNLYQGRLSNSGIRVQASYSTDSTILCFENDIRQVLNNLIGNSIDAMRSGGRLVARAHHAVDPITGRPGLRLTIADTGHGMSAATRARIFEPFFTTKDLNGTGLGLWISSDIVGRHHGRLTVRSSQHPVHHGTVFTLFLPEQPPEEPTSPNIPNTDGAPRLS